MNRPASRPMFRACTERGGRLMPKTLPILLFLFHAVLMPISASAQAEPAVNSTEPDAGTPSAQVPDVERAARFIIELANAFRREQGLDPVQPNQVLDETARDFAGFLARTERFGHGADGTGPAERAKRHGYKMCLISENLAYQFDSRGFATDELASKMVQGWKNSPGHRENMLDPDVTETGVALAGSDDSGQYFAVQLFGRPRSESIEFSIANDSSAAVSYRLDGQGFQLPPRYRRTHEQCRPAKLRLKLPGERDDKVIEPDDGERYRIEDGDSGGLRLRSD